MDVLRNIKENNPDPFRRPDASYPISGPGWLAGGPGGGGRGGSEKSENRGRHSPEAEKERERKSGRDDEGRHGEHGPRRDHPTGTQKGTNRAPDGSETTGDDFEIEEDPRLQKQRGVSGPSAVRSGLPDPDLSDY